MASLSFIRAHQLLISVNQIHETSEPQFYPSPTSAMLELTITLQFKLTRHFCSIGSSVDVEDDSLPVFHETLRFDLQDLANQQQAIRLLAPMLKNLGIPPTAGEFDGVADEIISRGLEISNVECNRGRKVLYLRTELTLVIVQHVTAVAAGFRRRNNSGMVPATCLSVKEMVKRFRVEDGDQEVDQDCTICLEEFKVNSGVSRMPCSHIFHTICIEQWLNTNHYCPLCRFKMPTFID